MFCSKCGNKVEEQARFCDTCGNSLIDIVESVPVPSTPLPPVESIVTNEINPTTIPTAPIKNKNKGTVAVVGLICVGVIVLFLLKEKGFIGSSETIETSGQEGVGELHDNLSASEEESVVIEGSEEITIEITHVDNQQFPLVKVYASISDVEGKGISSLGVSDFFVEEELSNGMVSTIALEDLQSLEGYESIAMNVVMDISQSMSENGKLDSANNAIRTFLSNKGENLKIELTTFSDFVYVVQSFTTDQNNLQRALENMSPTGGSAFYDAIYSAILQTYGQDGAKCVVVLTDGGDTSSNYTYDDIVTLSKNTGIPVYIVGLGVVSEQDLFQNLGIACAGDYFSIQSDTDVTMQLSEIYKAIEQQNRDQVVMTYRSTNLESVNEFRKITLKTEVDSYYEGAGVKNYVPISNVAGSFQADYARVDYICPDSSSRALTNYDLQGLSLAELRIARNEIYARYGRQFQDPLLNQWFYSKIWYLSIPVKYSPAEFSGISPQPLSSLENENAEFIKSYEEYLVATQEIYPNASTVLLSEYDLVLTKELLETALVQLNGQGSTAILEQNKSIVQEAISRMTSN